jgi:hypothetical protein
MSCHEHRRGAQGHKGLAGHPGQIKGLFYREMRMRQTEEITVLEIPGQNRSAGTCLPEVGEQDTTLVPGGMGTRPAQGPPGLGIQQGCVAAVGAGMAGLLGTVLECECAWLQEGGPMGTTRHHRAHQPLGSGQGWSICQVPHQDQ